MSEGIHVWFFCRVAEKYGYGMVWYGMVWRGVAWYGSSTVPILIKCIGLTMKSIHRLQLAQNAAARVIKRTPKREHMTPVLRDLHWLPINRRIEFKILLFVFKALHSEAPPYLCDLLNWYHPNRQLRSANAPSLVPNRNKTVKFGKRLMDTAAASLWNFLPDEIKCAPNIMIFKKTFKNILVYIVH